MTSVGVTKQKYYVSATGTILFHCTECDSSRSINVESLRSKKHVVKLRCTCGAVFLADLDFRASYRKKVRLPAICTEIENQNKEQFPCTITDLSTGGIAFKLNLRWRIKNDHKLAISFNLDDKARTAITRKIQVRNSRDKNVFGCAFIDPGNEVMNKAIYFYLK